MSARVPIHELCIGVIFGGPSGERRVSIESGRNIARALQTAGCRIRRLLIYDADDAARQIDATPLDLAFLALHGEFGEDGGIQRLLDERGIPYTGSDAEVSRLCMDKASTKTVLRAHRLPVCEDLLLNGPDARSDAFFALAHFGLPLVVKPNSAGSSLGVSIVRSNDQFRPALNRAFSECRQVLIEPYIAGRELTVALVDGAPLPVVEVVSKSGFYDYEAKYEDDATEYHCPAKLSLRDTLRVHQLAARAWNALGCRDVGRLDMILPAPGADPMIIEMNTIPGCTSHSLLPKAAAAAGISFPTLCCQLAAATWQRARKRMAS